VPTHEALRAELAAAYDAYAGVLYRYLLTILASVEEAEDVLQQVFLNLLQRLGHRPIRDLRSYLFRAARNQALMVLRKSGRRNRASAEELLCWIDSEACSSPDRDMAIDISRALQLLPVEQREVMVLKVSEGLTFAEIGKLLHISPNTAASRYRLGLARLRVLLESGEGNG